MKVLYRISEGGNIKNKLGFVHDKKQIFLHFIKIFKENNIYIFADNVSDELYTFILDNYNKYNDNNKIFRISLGNAKSFLHVTEFAINNFDENEKIYFAEDDYVYKIGANYIIEEGLNIADYSSGYDHPDKYVNHNEGGPNPFIQYGGELTRVLLTNNSHWKKTNSFCMTFATRVKTIKEDYGILNYCCQGKDPGDFGFFCEVRNKKNRQLVSCIPSVSTHGEIEWLAKFVDWEKEFLRSFQN
jgi:predicted heme/steroid binding protein